MKVYIIFDPAGIWERAAVTPVFARHEDAERVAREYNERPGRHPQYRLTVREYEVSHPAG